MGFPRSLSISTNLESLLETLDDLAVTILSDWQASKAYATLTGKKTMCTPKEFIPLVHKALSLVHEGKLARPASASAKEDVYMISQSLHDVLKSPGTAEDLFCVAGAPLGNILDHQASPAKRRKIMKDVPFYEEPQAGLQCTIPS